MTGWRKLKRFVCKNCEEPAYENLENKFEWKCAKCNYTTFSVFIFFKVRET